MVNFDGSGERNLAGDVSLFTERIKAYFIMKRLNVGLVSAAAAAAAGQYEFNWIPVGKQILGHYLSRSVAIKRRQRRGRLPSSVLLGQHRKARGS